MTVHFDYQAESRAPGLQHRPVPFWLRAWSVRELLGIVDPLVVLLSALVAKIAYIDLIVGDDRDLTSYLVVGTVGAAVTTGLINRSGFALRDATEVNSQRPVRILLTLSLAFAIVIAWLYALKASDSIARGWFGLWFLTSYVLLIAARVAYLRWRPALLRVEGSTRSLAIIGNTVAANALAKALGDRQAARFISVLDPSRTDVQALVEQLRPDVLDRVDAVVVCTDGLDTETIKSVLGALNGLQVDCLAYSELYSNLLPPTGLTALSGVPLIAVGNKRITERGLMVKRALDVVVSASLLLVTTPLMAAIALAIRLETGGPVLFWQKRHGLNRRVIRIAKFRTMTVAEDGPVIQQAVANDPRVTRVGRLLRRTSLDELPQLWNVLIGEMSLVGPRPHTIAHDEHYGAILERYCNRMQVKPGITGWAQVNGLRGPTTDPDLMRERVRYDLYYIDNWSIWFDLEVLLLTPLFGFVHRNAV